MCHWALGTLIVDSKRIVTFFMFLFLFFINFNMWTMSTEIYLTTLLLGAFLPAFLVFHSFKDCEWFQYALSLFCDPFDGSLHCWLILAKSELLPFSVSTGGAILNTNLLDVVVPVIQIMQWNKLRIYFAWQVHCKQFTDWICSSSPLEWYDTQCNRKTNSVRTV